jgi:hypothetical protein
MATGWQRFTLSIGVKGLIVFVALIEFLGSVALFAVHQKNLLLASFAEIESADCRATGPPGVDLNRPHLERAVPGASFSQRSTSGPPRPTPTTAWR